MWNTLSYPVNNLKCLAQRIETIYNRHIAENINLDFADSVMRWTQFTNKLVANIE